jgi:hypothetical protein
MTRVVRALGALACAGIVGAGCSSSPSASSTSTTQSPGNAGTITVPTTQPPVASTTPTAPTVTACNDVTASAGQTDGAAGTITGPITLTNAGGAACTMTGYPTLAMFSSSGSALTVTMVNGLTVDISAPANAAPTTVSLAPGAAATFTYQYSDVPSGSETSCPTSTTISVRPPTATSSSPPVPLSMDPCNNGSIRVSPVYPSS